MSLDLTIQNKIREDFLSNSLKVRSVSPTGEEEWKYLRDVMRHDSAQKNIVRVTLGDGKSAVVTVDHSLFLPGEVIRPVRTDELGVGSDIVVVEGAVTSSGVANITPLPCRLYMYDLCVPENESFVLSKSGILAHNSYSIGGVSLDLEKSSKYQGLMDSLQSRFESMIESAHRTVNISMGLQQYRYGIGVRSAFGPAVGSGILSPRNFVRF